jgi:hypothetical protein
MTDRFTRMRAATLRLVAWLVAVDLGMLALVMLTDIEEGGRRSVVGVVWLAATLAVVVPGLKAVRAARRS